MLKPTITLPLICMTIAIFSPALRGWAQDEPAKNEISQLRRSPCDTTNVDSLKAWQRSARTTLAVLLKMDDQLDAHVNDKNSPNYLALRPRVLEEQAFEKYDRYLIEIESWPGRKIKVVVTVPHDARPGKTPAVICIHGHGGNRNVVHEEGIYRGFATKLAQQGFVTLSTDVGQHDVSQTDRTLMGERLWDLIRLVDLAASRPEVDAQRIGCAGLSLGGEMAMWLGAMDTRIKATVSAGFLTTMENLRHGHCLCWDFPGLQRRYDFSDIYCLNAPRPLQCQIGKQERLPGGFPENLARQAMADIESAYSVTGDREAVELLIHPGGHIFETKSGISFLIDALKK